MATRFKNLKNDLEDFESDYSGSQFKSPREDEGFKFPKFILLFAFLATFGFYAISQISFDNIFDTNPVEVFQNLDEPSDDLLNRMGAWMTDMGYGELSREELIDLRSAGVTATSTSNFRELGFTDLSLEDLKTLGRADVTPAYAGDLMDIGYTDLTVDQLVDLQNAEVSATFASMMKSLGYELSPEDLARLRRAGVTAHFTSNMNDLGYSNITQDELIRMRSIGVTHEMVRDLIEENGNRRPSIEEIIRWRISNQ
jgi:hypothetical protein